MPMKKSAIIVATVGTTQRFSFSLSAGRMNPMISHTMIGVQTMAPKKSATLKRMVKPPRAVSTVSSVPLGMALRMASIITSMRVGVAK